MIHVVVPTKRKPKWLPTTPNYQRSVAPENKENIKSTELFGELFNRTVKRNKILQDLLEHCTFSVGDLLTPASKEELQEQGEVCEILEIYHNLTEYNQEWPDDNRPYTLKFKSLKTGKNFYCNPNYFKEYSEKASSGV